MPAPPSYRHTPDYETVMRQRVEQIAQVQQGQMPQTSHLSHGGLDPAQAQIAYLSNILNAQVYAHPETLAYSQPEMPRHQAQSSQVQYMGADITPGVPSVVNSSPHYPLRPVDRTSSLIIYPTYATPDAKSSLPNVNAFSTSDRMLNDYAYHYKAPPPYPRPSSSTPDLACQTLRSTMTGSPDLISRRHMQGLRVQSFLDQSVENLAVDAQKLTLSQQTAAQSKQNLDDSSSIHSEAVSLHNVRHGGSIPDVAHMAMLSHDYNLAPYMVNSAHSTVSPQSSVEATQSSGSSRSLPRPASFNMIQQPQQPGYDFTDPVSFDNPAFSENLKYYMDEVQASTNVDLSHVTADLPQVAAATNLQPEQVATPQPTQNVAPPVEGIDTTPVVLRRKPKDEDTDGKRDSTLNEVGYVLQIV